MEKSERTMKILKYAVIILAVIVLLEVIYFGVKMYISRKNSTYYSVANSSIKIDDGYVSVGLSDSKHSNFIKYKVPGYNKPYIWVYDNELKVTSEISLKKGFNGSYNDIVAIEDGYIAIGNLEMSEEKHKSGLTEAIIVKYDKEFNLVWRKNLNILDSTTFNKVKVDKDGNYVVVGSSLYASDVLGNETTGGAIIIKYDKDGNELLRINHGGPKTGEFKDLEIVEDGYVVVGLKGSGTGIIYKYDFNGKEVWHNYYGYTDGMGLTSITKYNNEFIVTASKLPEKNSNENYKAVILKFSNNGQLIKEQQYQKGKITRFNDSIVMDNKIIVIGVYGYQKDKTLINQSLVLTYDNNLELLDEKIYEGNKTYTLNEILALENGYLFVGHTDSKIKEFKTNGLDYYNIIKKIDL